MEQKQEIRTKIKAILRSKPNDQLGLWNLLLCERVKKYLTTPMQIALYKALSKEACVETIVPSLEAEGYQFCYPRVDNQELYFLAGPLFEKNIFSIWEPVKSAKWIPNHEIKICFIPLVAFDDKGVRLGKGKGFYDRFLADFTGKKVGLAFSCQQVESLPKDSHDILLDAVITEKEVLQFSS